MKWIYDDGGRAAAGFQGKTGDCGVRAIAIAAQLPYAEVYRTIHLLAKEMGSPNKYTSPRDGIPTKVMHRYMEILGWGWTATMKIGSGCQVHLREDELPAGRIVVRLSRHYSVVVDGVIRDTYDPQRIPFEGITEEDKESIHGTRCVYGYWKEVL